MIHNIKAALMDGVNVRLEATQGRVNLAGLLLLPHEAQALGEALTRSADHAVMLGFVERSNVKPEGV